MDAQEELYDSDEIDAETEAMLYAKIYHVPLDFWDSPETDKLTLKIPSVKNDFKEITTINDSISIESSSSPNSRHIDSESVEIRSGSKRKRDEIIWLSSDDDDDEFNDGNSVNSFTSSKSSSSFSDPFEGGPFSSNFETNLNLHILPSWRRPSTIENLPATTSFQSVTELLQNFTVAQIQSCLPKDKESWPILEEDCHWSGKFSKREVGRYYRRIRCNRCGEEGHRAKACTEPLKQSCFICGDESHTGWKCLQKTCLLCFSFGHFSEHCKRKKRAKFDNINCTRCTFQGHRSKDCSDIWRQFHSTVGKKKRLQKLKRRNGKNLRPLDAIFCYNCGRSGHFGAFCRRSTFLENGLTCFNPSVSYYDEGEEIVNAEKMFGNNEENESPCDPAIFSSEERKITWKSLNAGAKDKRKLNKKDRKKILAVDDVDIKNFKKSKKSRKLSVGRQNFDKLLKTKKKKKKNRQNLPITKPEIEIIGVPKKRKCKWDLRKGKFNDEQNIVLPPIRRKGNRYSMKTLQKIRALEDYAVNNVYNGLAQASDAKSVKRINKRAKYNFIHDGGKYSWDLPMNGRINGWLM